MNAPVRKFVNRARTWVKPGFFLPLMFLAYLFLEVLYAWMRGHDHAGMAELESIRQFRDSVFVALVVVAGFLRAKTNHPLHWGDYGRWLARTPWKPPKPLPLGPVHLSLADIVFVVVVALALHNPTINLVRLPSLFLFAYLSGSCGSLWRTGAKEYAYILAFGLGLFVRLLPDPWTSAALAVGLYVVAWFGLRRSFARFPWSIKLVHANREPPIKFTPSTDLREWATQRRPKTLGWPYDLLKPCASQDAISPLDGTLLSALLAWWIYAVMALVDPDPRQGFLFMLLFGVPVSAAIARLKLYTENYHSPMSGWGRLFTLRWIIPTYDRVFVAAFLTLAMPWLAGWFIWHFGVNLLLAAPIAIGCAVLIALNMGPTLNEWRLTGNHRVAPRYNKTTHFRL